MKKETKNEVKKNVATGASTAAGATTGVVIGSAITPDSAEAAEVVTPDPALQPSPAPEPAPEPVLEPEPVSQPTPEPSAPQSEMETEVEVVGYDRVTNEDGSQMDMAVLRVNGSEVGVVDVNLDGKADALVSDLNQNGVIEEGEIEIVQGQDIAMQPLADAAGFSPQFAQNDLPDYVNDADVDTYTA